MHEVKGNYTFLCSFLFLEAAYIWVWGLDCLGSHPGSAAYQLHDLEQDSLGVLHCSEEE